MSYSWFSSQLVFAQTTETPSNKPVNASGESNGLGGQVWMVSTIILFVIVASLVAYGQWQLHKLTKALNFEKFKSKDLKKKLKLALVTIRKME